ncbi:Type 1 glutamine amidotransferase-like domain-containing protein [Paenibacillus soyae]|uniref:Type 1 glutamine amidotransferase-like domain-containing protein n=1 Tax=Paenibacillus soyae TaxID=2969249 RepID=A0A9X2N024_9BACL|nr:Type 1 glutamine amidotransferase-like domain-containing protein [Paenibacillus soyae]MCR2806637.1 Type 1 glutamine amidotransferase-like domain-containing protein [Paenibacillus soyae]
MAKLLLTSNGFFTDTIKKGFLELIEGDIGRLRAAIITTASPKKESNRYAQKARMDFAEMGFRQVDFVDIEFQNPGVLERMDVVYINGGNPFQLLHYARKSGADAILTALAERNAVLVGVSAGSLLLGPHIRIVSRFTPEMNTPQLTDLSALHLTDHLIFPHYDREDLFPDSGGRSIEERIAEFESSEQCVVTRLPDDGYIAISGE